MVSKSTHNRRARAVDTGGFLFDEQLTSTVLKFAGPTVNTREQAAELFRGVAQGRPEPTQVPGPDGAIMGVWFVGPGATFDTNDWASAQGWLRKWLPKIAAADLLAESSASALAREFSQCMSGMDTAPRLGRRRGNYELTLYALRDSITNASIRGVLPFLLPYGWLRRLGQCHLKECGKWFLQKSRTGPPQQYCGPEHAGLARVRRFREKRA